MTMGGSGFGRWARESHTRAANDPRRVVVLVLGQLRNLVELLGPRHQVLGLDGILELLRIDEIRVATDGDDVDGLLGERDLRVKGCRGSEAG